ncbi:MAG: hypothetical protein IT497_06795 [Ottowia sp.]|nr:hypothetical protein [Ottowia sp.]
MKNTPTLTLPLLTLFAIAITTMPAQAQSLSQQNTQAPITSSLINDSAVNPLTGQPQSYEQMQRATEQAQMVTKYLDEKVKQAQALEKLKAPSVSPAEKEAELAAKRVRYEEAVLKSKIAKAASKKQPRQTLGQQTNGLSATLMAPATPMIVSEGYIQLDDQRTPIQRSTTPVNRIASSEKTTVPGVMPTVLSSESTIGRGAFVPAPFPSNANTATENLAGEAIPMQGLPIMPSPNFGAASTPSSSL